VTTPVDLRIRSSGRKIGRRHGEGMGEGLLYFWTTAGRMRKSNYLRVRSGFRFKKY